MEGYNIEISVNLFKQYNYIDLDRELKEKSQTHNCNDIYVFTDENIRKKKQLNCIYVINFCDEYFENLLQFISEIKRCKSYYIECIYKNDTYKLLYASTYYLNTIDKDIVVKYKKFIKNKIFTKNEKDVIYNFIKNRS